MFTRFVRDVYWTTGDAAGGGVVGAVVVDGLEHVPVRSDVEVLGEDCVSCVTENMPGMRFFDFGEEVVAVSDEDWGAVGGHLAVEQNLRSL